MTWQTSFFSPALFKLNLRRFWPLAVVVFAAVLFFPGVGIISVDEASGHSYGSVASSVAIVYDSVSFVIVVLAGACMIAALGVFGHLHARRKTAFFHGLPVTRTAHYVTACVSAIVLVIAPLALGLAACLALAVAVGGKAAVASGVAVAVARELWAAVASFAILFALAALSCVVCGNALGAILVYVALNCAGAVIVVGSSLIAGMLVPGVELDSMTSGPVRAITPVLALLVATRENTGFGDDGFASVVGFSDSSALVGYAVAGLALLVATGALARLRRDETAGETVSFGVVRTVCKVLFALVISVVGTDFVVLLAADSVTYGHLLALLVVLHLAFAAVGWFVAEMIVRRTVRVWDARSIRGCFLVLAALLVVFGLARLDVLGIASRVPSPEQVKTASIELNGRWVEVAPEDAAKLHRCVLDNRQLLAGDSYFGLGGGDSLRIVYELENGRGLYRAYSVVSSYAPAGSYDEGAPEVQLNAIMACCEEILQSPAAAHQYLLGFKQGAYGKNDLVSVTVFFNESPVWASLDDAETAHDGVGAQPSDDFGHMAYGAEGWGLYEAVCADIAQGNVDVGAIGYQSDAVGFLEFEWRMPVETGATAMDEGNRGYYYSWSFEVTEDMTNAIAWIANHPSDLRG